MDFTLFDKLVYKEAFNCLNMLDKRLGTKRFFFGNSPSTFDAVLYGYLGILLHAPLASTELQVELTFFSIEYYFTASSLHCLNLFM